MPDTTVETTTQEAILEKGRYFKKLDFLNLILNILVQYFDPICISNHSYGRAIWLPNLLNNLQKVYFLNVFSFLIFAIQISTVLDSYFSDIRMVKCLVITPAIWILDAILDVIFKINFQQPDNFAPVEYRTSTLSFYDATNTLI